MVSRSHKPKRQRVGFCQAIGRQQKIWTTYTHRRSIRRHNHHHKGHTMNPEQLADQAANAAIKHIQDSLNIEDGGFAGAYFSDEKWNELVNPLVEYIKAENA